MHEEHAHSTDRPDQLNWEPLSAAPYALTFTLKRWSWKCQQVMIFAVTEPNLPALITLVASLYSSMNLLCFFFHSFIRYPTTYYSNYHCMLSLSLFSLLTASLCLSIEIPRVSIGQCLSAYLPGIVRISVHIIEISAHIISLNTSISKM